MLAAAIAGAALAGVPALCIQARAASFSDQECRLLAGAFVTTLKSRDIQSFSSEFRQSFVDFISPDRKSQTCTGPSSITYKTDADRALVAQIYSLAADYGVNVVAKGFPTFCTQTRTYTFQPKRFDISETDYLCTQLAGLGLPYDLVKGLSDQNLSSTHIIHGTEDARALGLVTDPKTGRIDRDAIKDMAILDRADPGGRAQRLAAYKAYDAWLKKNKAEIQRLQDAIARAETAAEKKKAEAELGKLRLSAPRL